MLRIGTRGSLLARAQTELVASALTASDSSLKIEVVEIKTLGDRKQGTAAARQGDKKDWILELEKAVLAGEIDLAVHSGKDVPADIERGTEIAAVLLRESPFDVFIGRMTAQGTRLRWSDLPRGAVVGTASLRRQASLLRMRPDLQVVEHRGNVPTRLKVLDESSTLHGIVLAEAGIKRLSLLDVQYEVFPSDQLMPAVNQGIICVQYRADNTALRSIVKRITDPATHAAWRAERSCIELLQADCKSAVSAFATVKDGTLFLSVRVMLPDGSTSLEELHQTSPFDSAAQLGEETAQKLISRGAKGLIESSRTIETRRASNS